jgi:hypothetical protein
VVPRVGSGSKDCLLRNRSTKSPASPSIESLGFYSGGGYPQPKLRLRGRRIASITLAIVSLGGCQWSKIRTTLPGRSTLKTLQRGLPIRL